MDSENGVVIDSSKLFNQVEIERIEKIYSGRNYDNDFTYKDVDPIYLHRTQSVERVTLAALSHLGLASRLSELKILDFGCGNGRWMSRWLSWGVIPENMAATDIREDALKYAHDHVPQAECRLVNEMGLDFSDESFDVVYLNLVFSSILDDGYRKHAADEIARVLKPGGVVLWYDFTFNNPGNKNVRRVTYDEVQKLFSDHNIEFSEKIVLAPPIAKRVVPVSWLIADVLEAVPFLRTHLFAVLRKPAYFSLADGCKAKLRLAKKRDVTGIVDVHMAAFEGFPLTLLGRRFLKLLYQSFVDRSNAILVVAEYNDKIIGFAAGTLRPETFFKKLLVRKGLLFLTAIASGFLRHPRLVISRLKMAIFYRGEKPEFLPEQRAALLSSMAVLPGYAGKAVGTKLLNEYCQLAKQNGSEAVYLTTDSGHNEKTNLFYVKQGFVLTSKIDRQHGRNMNLYLRRFV